MSPWIGGTFWVVSLIPYELRRWADRKGCVVRWGNLVGPYRGQEFEEEFRTEEEAMQRERQALACEPIPDDKEPIPIRRVNLH